MAKPLDLQEQEQLDDIKHFWKKYGNLITWVMIAVFGSIAAWNGWQYWQRSQAAQASAIYDEVERAAQAGDTARVERAFADIKDKFGRTAYAQQAGLLTAKVQIEGSNSDAAKASLAWVAERVTDAGYQAVARLRLSAIAIDAKAYDEALKHLEGSFPAEFAGLVADRRGDIFQLQGKRAEAVAEYGKAYQLLDPRSEYRRVVEIKLGALGGDPRSLVSAAAAANPSAVAKP
jgi:predicted negative regulator of RcsB-dependent stress response